MTSYRTFGPLGLIVLLFGVLAGLMSGTWSSMYVLAHLILGGMMLSLYLFTHIDSLKERVGGRQAKYGTNAVVYTVLTLAVLVAINYIGAQRSWRWDLTEQGVFSLAGQTTQLLESLQDDVVARAFFREGEEGAARDLLDSFEAASSRFSYEFIDPDKRPELAEQYEISQYSTIHLTAGSETSRLTEINEEQLTNTLLRLTSARRRLIYYVSGHGEADLTDSTAVTGFGQASAALGNEGYDVEPLVLAAVPDVPADADMIIVAGPQRAFLERELEVLDRYIGRGGRAVILIDPQQGDDLRPVLQARGVEFGDDVIIEEFMQLFAGSQVGVEPVVGDYGAHPITSGFSQRTIYSMARSVGAADTPPDGVQVAELARTSANSWGESDLERLFDTGEVGQDDADTDGPLAIGVAVTLSADALEWTAPLLASARNQSGDDGAAETAPVATEAPADLEGRLVVFGDSEWVTNRYINNFYNQDLFLNAVGWLAGEEEMISIRPRLTRASTVMLTANEMQGVFYLTVLLLPELILFFGMMTWLGRRNPN